MIFEFLFCIVNNILKRLKLLFIFNIIGINGMQNTDNNNVTTLLNKLYGNDKIDMDKKEKIIKIILNITNISLSDIDDIINKNTNISILINIWNKNDDSDINSFICSKIPEKKFNSQLDFYLVLVQTKNFNTCDLISEIMKDKVLEYMQDHNIDSDSICRIMQYQIDVENHPLLSRED